jgi:putative selenium metabolism hydrolase
MPEIARTESRILAPDDDSRDPGRLKGMSDWGNVVELTRKLVAAHSYETGGEAAAIDVARQAMTALGFDEVRVDAMGNLTGTMPGNGASGCIVFDGHVDTVGVGDASAWTSDPFTAVERDGRLFGRGVADMKGAIAAMIVGVSRLKDDPAPHDVVVSVSIAEEMVEGVALGMVLDQYRPDIVVIGEATNLHLATAQRGRAEIVVETHGIPAHSSTPHLGRNPIRAMAIIGSLLTNLPMPTDEKLGPAILEITDIVSDPYPGLSVIPERCRATFDRRLLLGETEEDIVGEIQSLLNAYSQNDLLLGATVSIAVDSFDTWNGYRLEAKNFAPAWRTPDDHPLVRSALDALGAAGLVPMLTHYAFCTNGSESAGRRDIPTIGFGPGEEAQAHRIDESVEMGHLVAAANGYETLARHADLGG